MIFMSEGKKRENWAPPPPPLPTVSIGLDSPLPNPHPHPLEPPLGQVDSLMLGAAFLVFCSFLPQFSKGSDVSGLAPTLSINRFKSNKCGIFSRTCVHSPCLTVEQGFSFFFVKVCHWLRCSFLPFCRPFFSVFLRAECLRVSSVTVHAPHLSFLNCHFNPAPSNTPPPLRAPRLCGPTPFSDCRYVLHPNGFHHFHDVVESIARSSFKTTGFCLWHNKKCSTTWRPAFLSLLALCLSYKWFVVPSIEALLESLCVLV